MTTHKAPKSVTISPGLPSRAVESIKGRDNRKELMTGKVFVEGTNERSQPADRGMGSAPDTTDLMQIRALHIGPLPPPAGGMATVLTHLSHALGDRCRIIVHNNAKTTPVDRTLMQGVQAQCRLLARLWRTLNQWRPSIVHIHTCSEFAFWRNGLDLLLVKLFCRAVVLHIHGARFHEFLGLLGPAKAWLARVIFERADCVVVLGKVWEQRLGGWCGPQQLVIVPNGVFVPTEDRSVNRVSAGKIICLANYERRKGLEDLIRAVAAVRATPVSLLLLGSEAEPGYRQFLERLSVELGIRDRVSMPGPVPFDQIGKYLQEADVFCLPSHNEGLPMALLEAMAYGLPVVVTRVGAIPEAVNDGVEGCLYEAGDVGALTACLDRLLSDPDFAKRMGDNARGRAARDFSVDAMAAQIFNIYVRLLHKRPQVGELPPGPR